MDVVQEPSWVPMAEPVAVGGYPLLRTSPETTSIGRLCGGRVSWRLLKTSRQAYKSSVKRNNISDQLKSGA